MLKCPVCQTEVDYLYAKQEKVGKLSLTETGEPTWEPYGPFGEHTETEYRCPNCDAFLVDNQDDAVKLLKGELLGR